MTTTRLVELAPYRIGDLERIPCHEPDPEPGWAQEMEQNAHGIRSIHLNGRLIASFGYMAVTRHEVDSFAVIDRDGCAGVGRDAARIIRNQCKEWIQQYGFTTVKAYCPANDRAARVFLRAIGYREQAPISGEMITFIFSGRN